MRFLLSVFLVTLLALLAPGTADAADLKPTYIIKTKLGEMKLQLDAEKAPATVLNFDQYVADGFYNGTIFHRVVANFAIQGGGFGPDEKLKSGLRAPIANEWRNGLKNVRGSIAAVHQVRRPDSATSQFLINLKDNPILDKSTSGAGYCVFGSVVEGLDVLDAIAKVPVERKAAFGGRELANPVEPLVIESITVVSPLDRVAAEAQIAVVAAAAAAKEAEEKAAAEKAAMAPVEDFVAKKEAELGVKRQVTASGLISLVMKEGTGDRNPTAQDKVSVHYTGTLLDGTEFDSSRREGRTPFDVNLSGGVIDGWLEGLKLMRVGERRLFVIPPALGYGEAGAGGSIPPNAWLVFDVEMLSMN